MWSMTLRFHIADCHECAVITGNHLQFFLVFEAVNLIQVDFLDAEAVQRAFGFLSRSIVPALLRLTPEENLFAVLSEFWPEFEFRIAVGRCHAEVVHAVIEDVFDHLVYTLLFEPLECYRTERH